MNEGIYREDVEVGTRELADGWELPVRGEVVRIVSGELAGEEGMVEAVERDTSAGTTYVLLRIYGFPWPIEEPANAVARIDFTQVSGSQRSHRWKHRQAP